MYSSIMALLALHSHCQYFRQHNAKALEQEVESRACQSVVQGRHHHRMPMKELLIGRVQDSLPNANL